jgi:hypothetical protein
MTKVASFEFYPLLKGNKVGKKEREQCERELAKREQEGAPPESTTSFRFSEIGDKISIGKAKHPTFFVEWSTKSEPGYGNCTRILAPFEMEQPNGVACMQDKNKILQILTLDPADSYNPFVLALPFEKFNLADCSDFFKNRMTNYCEHLKCAFEGINVGKILRAIFLGALSDGERDKWGSFRSKVSVLVFIRSSTILCRHLFVSKHARVLLNFRIHFVRYSTIF